MLNGEMKEARRVINSQYPVRSRQSKDQFSIRLGGTMLNEYELGTDN